MIKPGTKWWTGEGKVFQIINVVEVDGHTWVYYRNTKQFNEEYQEYSCYLESFLQRFNPLPE